MAKYFKINEMIRSETADRKGIDNFPNEKERMQILDNLIFLMDYLDSIRSKFGKAICVSSGYRCEALNKAVGGVQTSRHQFGLAADLQCYDNKKLYDMIAKHFDYDELIWENGGTWVHFSVCQDKKQNRHKKL